MLKLFLALSILISTPSWSKSDLRCDEFQTWPEWAEFREKFLSTEGRVIDTSDERHITTSEGQSYALFFALLENNPALFRRILRWTEKNLAKNDLTSHLPSWLWGKDEKGRWDVLDSNTASDSNLWIAYSLLEAGRLWNERTYTVLGTMMLQKMSADEVVSIPGLGFSLLPGKRGFVHGQAWRLNPSYIPPQLVSRVSQVIDEQAWRKLAENTPKILMSIAPQGIAPDWMTWTVDGWSRVSKSDGVGSYDAVRVYLWIGMMHPDAPEASTLRSHFNKISQFLDEEGYLPERIDVATEVTKGRASLGFSAALLPLFQDGAVGKQLRLLLRTSSIVDAGYYERMLLLFGKAWDEQRYVFDMQGQVVPAWTACK